MPRLQERAKCLVSQLLDEREQRKSKETASEELTLALSEEDTLPDPARPVHCSDGDQESCSSQKPKAV